MRLLLAIRLSICLSYYYKLLAMRTPPGHHHTEMTIQTIKNVPHRHAFALVGEETLFLCHQIMTHMEVHSYELILEVTIPQEKKQAILADRRATGHAHYLGCSEGEEFILPSAVAGSRTSFIADVWTSVPDSNPPTPLPQPLWEGNNDISPWLSDVEVSIVRTVHVAILTATTPVVALRTISSSAGDGRPTSCIRSSGRRITTTLPHLSGHPTGSRRITRRNGEYIHSASLPWDPGNTQVHLPFRQDDSVQEVYYFGFTEFPESYGRVTK